MRLVVARLRPGPNFQTENSAAERTAWLRAPATRGLRLGLLRWPVEMPTDAFLTRLPRHQHGVAEPVGGALLQQAESGPPVGQGRQADDELDPAVVPSLPVEKALDSIPHISESFYFWTGESRPDSAARHWSNRLRKALLRGSEYTSRCSRAAGGARNPPANSSRLAVLGRSASSITTRPSDRRQHLQVAASDSGADRDAGWHTRGRAALGS